MEGRLRYLRYLGTAAPRWGLGDGGRFGVWGVGNGGRVLLPGFELRGGVYKGLDSRVMMLSLFLFV